MLDAGIVDEDVDGSESALGAVDRLAELLGLGDVGPGPGDLHAVRLRDVAGQGFAGLAFAEAVEHHVHALRGELFGDG